tara:strand:- start:467 stop:706 length:240 start_codon:yes stop_codon:yes gene_type:complete
MPKFKGKHYAYTKEGYAAYKRAKEWDKKKKEKATKSKRPTTVRKGFQAYNDALKDRGEYPKIRTVKLSKKRFKSRKIKI